jgi:hypothetical protein
MIMVLHYAHKLNRASAFLLAHTPGPEEKGEQPAIIIGR